MGGSGWERVDSLRTGGYRGGRRRFRGAVAQLCAALGIVTALISVSGLGAPPASAGGSPYRIEKSSPTLATSLSGVSCPSTSDCTAVGTNNSNGAIAATSDSGSTWAAQAVPPGVVDLAGVACPTTSECVAVGVDTSGAAAILATTDGGLTWVSQAPPSGAGELFGVSCNGTAACTAVGDNSSGSAPVIVASNDPFTGVAATWAAQTVPPGVGGLVGISCSFGADCVAVGTNDLETAGAIVATTGLGWATQTVPSGVGALSGVFCSSGFACIAVGTNTSGAAAIVATADAGTTWTTQTAPSGVGSLNSVSCSSEHCAAVGGVGASTSGTATIVATNDGGSTWATQTAPLGILELLGVSCSSASDCTAVGTNGSATLAVIVATTDGGSTWTTQGGAYELDGVSCSSASNCTAVGENGPQIAAAILATTDGGSTWATQTVSTDFGGLNGVSCSSAVDCTAVGFGFHSITATTDGGSTWATQATPSEVGDLGDVSCTSASDCTTAGENATDTGPVIAATTDGGSTWATQAVPFGASVVLHDVSCTSASDCTAVGSGTSGGAIGTTTDGGSTWSSQTVPSGVSSLYGVSCSSAVDCAAVGSGTSGGAIVTTTDGGSTWTSQTVPSGVYGLNHVSCSSTSDCTAVGENSTGGAVIAATTDGGSTWATETVPSGVSILIGVSCVFTAGCTAVGRLSAGGAVIVGQAPPPPPTVTNVAPTSGPAAGGTTVTVTGTGFTGATAIDFGTTPATSFSCSSDTSCSAVSPPGQGTVDITVTTPGGTSATSPADLFGFLAPAGVYHPLTPERILDTRNGTGGHTGPLGAGGELDLQVGGADNVQAAATAVVLNVTVTDTTSSSFLTVWPQGVPRPTASNLNWSAGVTVPNLVEVALGSSGEVSFYNALGSTDVIADVEGYYMPQTPHPQTAGLFNPLSPERILDTRGSIGGHPGPLGANESLDLQVSNGVIWVPSGASAVVLNVTVTDTTSSSFLTVWPQGAPRPIASNLNFVAGQTVPNRVMVPLSSSGGVSIYNDLGSANVIVDVGGYFSDGTAITTGDTFTPAPTPTRILDTRTNVGGHNGPIPANSSINLAVGGANVIPSDVTAVVANTTVTDTSAASYLTVYPDDVSRPTASDLNWSPGETVPNLVVAKLGGDGGWSIYNNSGTTNAISDVAGWYAP